MYNICLYFFMFYCYSIMGWFVECIASSIRQKKIVHDRGFLIGPYCPIYGYGAMYMYFFLNRYHDDLVILFVMTIVGTSILEYLTSYFMEKIFKARWWDYSQLPFNINGRICLTTSLSFGILGVAFTYIINPNFLFIAKKIPKMVLIVISTILFILFVIDTLLTFSIMAKLKKNLSNIKKDSTTDIDRQVKEILSKNTFYLTKLFNSFPKVKFSFPIGEQILSSIKKSLGNMNKLKQDRRKTKRKLRKELKQKK